MKQLVVTLKNGIHVYMYFEHEKEAKAIRDKILKCKSEFCEMIDTATVRVKEVVLIEIMDVEMEENKDELNN
ncbi:hypothetical protein [Enterococcus wangshanyuanii]|uniref:Uncharacterized protein n=1 Tax=Enterococcus wangshanyuanii TaxID=2005703 RepID=A0ABQ1PUI6_9ENTE|nr:hypothetical protein [Enterococcus wangshanyuanii]GGD03757.1 hypothetical protein GCM10011573_36550 [Enterococcus wangshanyuanii]